MPFLESVPDEEEDFMTVLEIIFLMVWSLFGLALLYLYFLAVAGLFPERGLKKHPPGIMFAVIIPAHDEAKVIGRTLVSLKQINYPGALFNIIVIADNCEDRTAEISRNLGAICWERKNPHLKGKSNALHWAFNRLLEEGNHDAYVIIDADTVVEPDFLRALNNRLFNGAQVVQAYYDAIDPQSSPVASLSYLGFVISRTLKYTGRTRLGWTTNLLGNGMCFTRKVIQRFGWNAESIVEDIEYEMILQLGGVRVVFAPEIRIYAEIPNSFKGAKTQRGRWDIGKYRVMQKYLIRLIKMGIMRLDLSYFDSAMEMIIPPFSHFTFLILAFSFFYLALAFHPFSLVFFMWCSVIGALGIYAVWGFARAHAPLKIYVNLLYAPYFLLWRLYVVIADSLMGKHRNWLKTERK